MSGLKGHAEPGAGHRMLELDRQLKFLSPRENTVIDDRLASVSPFGEVHLPMRKGKVRFVPSVKSHDAFQPTGKAGRAED